RPGARPPAPAHRGLGGWPAARRAGGPGGLTGSPGRRRRPARRGVPHRRGPGFAAVRPPRLPRPDVGARTTVRAALRRRARPLRFGGDTRPPRAIRPLRRPTRRTTGLVPLSPDVP